MLLPSKETLLLLYCRSFMFANKKGPFPGKEYFSIEKAKNFHALKGSHTKLTKIKHELKYEIS